MSSRKPQHDMVISRRSILAILGFSPVLKAAPLKRGPLDYGMPGTGPEQVKAKLFPDWRMPPPDLLERLNEYTEVPQGTGCGRIIGTSTSISEWITKHSWLFNTELGDCGRGHKLPVEIVIALVPYLTEMGFVPFQTPGKNGFDCRYLQLYGCSGAAASGVWYGFVREHGAKSDIIAFENTAKDTKEFHERVGMTLAEAMEN